jgi:hypothetical protein
MEWSHCGGTKAFYDKEASCQSFLFILLRPKAKPKSLKSNFAFVQMTVD